MTLITLLFNSFISGSVVNLFLPIFYMLRCLKRTTKNFVLRSDLFAAPATLRYGGESNYQSIFGGILSIALVIAFAVIFYSSFVDVLNKVIISAQVDIQTDPSNVHKIDDLQFGIGIHGIDFSSNQRYFIIDLVHISNSLEGLSTETHVELSTCNKTDWQDVGNHFDTLFDVHEMDKMLCPIAGQHIELEGYKGSQIWQFLEVRVEKCVNQTGVSWTCYPQTDIDTFMNTYLLVNDYFQVNIFMVDTLFSPLKDVYLTKSLEEEIFLSFSTNTGSRGTIKIGDYNITTDHSIWPVQDTTQEIGHYISDYSTHTIQLFSTHYVKMIIEKDQTVYAIGRQHGKFDEMLSYVGGLFSLLFAFIVFFIGSYSQYKYQIAVAESAFVLDSTGRKVRDQNFGFFTFLKYCLYDWIDSLGCSISWKRMETIHKARQEATEQLDVRFMIKKMQRFQRINELLLKERNLICAQLTEPPTLQKIKKLRKITQYYDKVIREGDEEEPEVKVKQSAVIPESNVGMNESLDFVSEVSQQELKKEEEELDLDSQDQQVEKEIEQAFHKLKEERQSKQGTKVSKQIYNSIPKAMKKRLLRLGKNRQVPIEFNNNNLNSSLQLQSMKKKKKDPEFVAKDFDFQ